VTGTRPPRRRENGLIPEGAELTLELEGLVTPDTARRVRKWLAGSPERQQVTWSPDPGQPLRWAAAPGRRWSPGNLRNEVFSRAGLPLPEFTSTYAWCCNGASLRSIAGTAPAPGTGTAPPHSTSPQTHASQARPQNTHDRKRQRRPKRAATKTAPPSRPRSTGKAASSAPSTTACAPSTSPDSDPEPRQAWAALQAKYLELAPLIDAVEKLLDTAGC
jgi:hypothetical protein